MTDIRIDATIRPGDLPTVKLEGATLSEIEKAAQPSQPFDDEIKAAILEIAGRGKRVHLMSCPGTAYINGARVYQAFDSSKKAFGWSISQANAV
jgi:hypothetical protein